MTLVRRPQCQELSHRERLLLNSSRPCGRSIAFEPVSHELPRCAQQRSLPVTQHQACPQGQAAAVRWPAGGRERATPVHLKCAHGCAAVGSQCLGNRGAQILRALLSARPGVRSAFVNVRGGGAVDQETEQFRPAVVAARVHHLLALVDQREVEVGDDHAFTRRGGARPARSHRVPRSR